MGERYDIIAPEVQELHLKCERGEFVVTLRDIDATKKLTNDQVLKKAKEKDRDKSPWIPNIHRIQKFANISGREPGWQMNIIRQAAVAEMEAHLETFRFDKHDEQVDIRTVTELIDVRPGKSKTA